MFGCERNEAIGLFSPRLQSCLFRKLLGFDACGFFSCSSFGCTFGFRSFLCGTSQKARVALLRLTLALGLTLCELWIVLRRLRARPFELRLFGLGRSVQTIRKTFFLETAHAVEPIAFRGEGRVGNYASPADFQVANGIGHAKNVR